MIDKDTVQRMTAERLLEIYNHREDYLPEAIEIVRAEIERRAGTAQALTEAVARAEKRFDLKRVPYRRGYGPVVRPFGLMGPTLTCKRNEFAVLTIPDSPSPLGFFMFGWLWVLFAWVARGFRRRPPLDIDLKDAAEIVTDDRKQVIAVRARIHARERWLGLRPLWGGYEEAVDILKTVVPVQTGRLLNTFKASMAILLLLIGIVVALSVL